MINHIGHVEGHVIVAITANELGGAGGVAAVDVKGAVADAEYGEADAGTVPGVPAEEPIGSGRGERRGPQICTDFAQSRVIRTEDQARTEGIHLKGSADAEGGLGGQRRDQKEDQEAEGCCNPSLAGLWFPVHACTTLFLNTL